MGKIDEIKLSIESEDFAQRRTGRKGTSYYNGLAAGYREGYRKRSSEVKETPGERQSNIPDVKASALEKLKIAKKALNDIYNFDRDMEFEYGDPGERAMRALEAIDRIDGF